MTQQETDLDAMKKAQTEELWTMYRFIRLMRETPELLKASGFSSIEQAAMARFNRADAVITKLEKDFLKKYPD